MKSSRQLIEERQELALECRAIYDAAKTANRDLTQEEVTRFDEISKEEHGLIAKLDKEIADAKGREEKVIAYSLENQRRSRLEELTAPGGILNPNPTQARVLPTNGQLPTENADGQQPYRAYVRQKKLKAFPDERTAHDCSMWFRAFVARIYNRDDKPAQAHIHRLGRGWEVTNVATEGVGGAGGYLVPAPLSQTIIDVRDKVGIARQILKILPMTSDTLSIPRRAGGLTVYYPGEAQAITLSDKSWQQIQLIAKKRAVAHQISQELQDDALISIVDDAMGEMAYALADKEDAEAINGDSTATYGGVTGLLASLGAAGTYTADTGDSTWPLLDMDDFTGTMGLLPEKYGQTPVWLSSNAFWNSTMVRIGATASGNNIQSLQQGPTGKSFMGYPVFTTDKMPRTTAVSQVSALFGSFDMGAILGERVGVRLDRSDDYAFLNDVITVRGISRYDINVHAGGDASTAGAYVGLKTAAS